MSEVAVITIDGPGATGKGTVCSALGAAAPVRIRDCVNVNTSFPGFVEAANHLGADLRQEIAA